MALTKPNQIVGSKLESGSGGDLRDRPAAPPSGTQRLLSMEGLRGYAAFIVYALHFIGQFYSQRKSTNLDEFGMSDLKLDAPSEVIAYWVFSSHYGVDIFFALSGYLIAGIVVREGFRYFPYLVSRIMRIYPVLVTSTLVYVFYRVIFMDGAIWWGGIFGNILLLNGVKGIDFPAINIVTWSLFFEMAFYILFPLIWLMSGKSLLRFLCLSLLLLCILITVNEHYVRFLMFVGGVGLRLFPVEYVDRLRSSFSDGKVALLYVVAAGTFLLTKNFICFIPIFILPCLLLIDRVLHVDGWLQRVFCWRPLRYFGNISFSFYIYHPLGLSVARALLEPLPDLGDLDYFFAFLSLSFFASLVFATVSYLLFERLYFLLKQRYFAGAAQRVFVVS